MQCFRSSVLAVAFACGAFCAMAASQDDRASKHVRTLPAPADPRPFSAESIPQESLYTIEFRSAEQLSAQDRLLVSNAESTVAEHAGIAGLEYRQGIWTYQEIVCPTFPNHLFLQYSRRQGDGDVTVFSASIPRNGEGRVRIVPILKRSYSLFSPAPVNALTISAFNHIRAEEGESANADWLGNALCYAALAGAQPSLPPVDGQPSSHRPVPALRASLDIKMQTGGEEVIRFDDAAARPHPMEWAMTFTRKGRLIKATRKAAGTYSGITAGKQSAILHTRQIPDSSR